MLRSYRICRAFGIPIRIHGTLIAVLPLVALLISGLSSVSQYLIALAQAIALFGFVLLHEFGHALAARRVGVSVRSITLYPIGGVAALAQLPRDPRAEFRIAIAGPTVNFFCAALFALCNQFAPSQVLNWLVNINLILCAFNLFPCYPMDGGRILRSLLALRYSYPAATRAAVRIGQCIAAAMFTAGVLLVNPMISVIAVVVFYFAEMELRVPEDPLPASPPIRSRTGAGVLIGPAEWSWRLSHEKELQHATRPAPRDSGQRSAPPFVRGVIIEFIPSRSFRKHFHN